MKKWFAILSLVIVTVCSIYPCCLDDDCGNEPEDSHATSHSQDEEKEQGLCSPFSVCTSCAAYVEMEPLLLRVDEYEPALPFYHTYLASYREGIYTSLFQPPRNC